MPAIHILIAGMARSYKSQASSRAPARVTPQGPLLQEQFSASAGKYFASGGKRFTFLTEMQTLHYLKQLHQSRRVTLNGDA
jgi:hypothetical protein